LLSTLRSLAKRDTTDHVPHPIPGLLHAPHAGLSPAGVWRPAWIDGSSAAHTMYQITGDGGVANRAAKLPPSRDLEDAEAPGLWPGAGSLRCIWDDGRTRSMVPEIAFWILGQLYQITCGQTRVGGEFRLRASFVSAAGRRAKSVSAYYVLSVECGHCSPPPHCPVSSKAPVCTYNCT